MIDTIYHLAQLAGFAVCTGLLIQVWRHNQAIDS